MALAPEAGGGMYGRNASKWIIPSLMHPSWDVYTVTKKAFSHAVQGDLKRLPKRHNKLVYFFICNYSTYVFSVFLLLK